MERGAAGETVHLRGGLGAAHPRRDEARFERRPPSLREMVDELLALEDRLAEFRIIARSLEDFLAHRLDVRVVLPREGRVDRLAHDGLRVFP
jgi:hypothetical protein